MAVSHEKNNEETLYKLLKAVGRERVCRACLSTSEDFMIPLIACRPFFEQETEMQISIIFSRFTSVVMDNEQLPSNLCSRCVDYLWKLSAFREQCIESDSLLRNVISKFDKTQQEKMTIRFLDKNTDINIIDKIHSDNQDFDNPPQSHYDEEDISKNYQVSENNKCQLENHHLECSICKDIFKNPILLLKHRKIHGKKVHQCIVCGNGFTTSRGLKIHSRSHTGEKPEVCTTCNKAFSDPRALRDHQKSHTGLKQFQCDNCSKRFSHKRVLQNHVQTHTGDRPYACDLCDKRYIQYNNLIVHRRTHTGERPYACLKCNKTFTSRASLSLHMPVHTESKAFMCNWCGKRLGRSGDLIVHVRTHTGERPYLCTQTECGKAFSKSSSLQAHLLTHTGEKKYICPICGHCMAHAGKLTVHVRTHNNDKPHSCNDCGKKFSNKNYLTQHAKLHAVSDCSTR